MGTWIQKQHTLIKVAQANQRNSDVHLLEDLDRSSARIQVQSDTIEGLRRQLEDAKNTIRVTERIRHQA
jgi:hypothetical protein